MINKENKMEKKKLEQLEETYLKAKIAYYDGTPILTDSEFDALEKILKEEGSKAPDQVGSKRKDFDFSHPTKMLSLLKIQTEATENGTNYMEEEFMKWYKKRESIIGGSTELLSSMKFDGNAINIIYRGRNLSNILTRGDGFTGKDITKRFKGIIPSTLDLLVNDSDVIEIRCEVVIKMAIFNSKYASEFANPRNYVAGVIGKDDEDTQKVSELTIIPLNFLLNGNHVNQFDFREMPFYSKDWNQWFKWSNYVDTIKYYEGIRKDFDYQLDGIVISFPVEWREILGVNEHHPEWAVAIKYVPTEVVTEVEDVEWNISKRGELIPTMLLKPVFFDGSTVGRASGYNANYLIKNSIGPGAVVSLIKSGDIIPSLLGVIKPSDSERVQSLFPEFCPYCGSDIEFNDVHLLCTNSECTGRIAKQLAGAVKILELSRIGEKTIEPFAQDFQNMWELIRWARTEGATISGNIDQYGIKYGSRSHQIFIEAFTNIKSLTYTQVIQMLGYDNVGEKISIQLSREHAGLDYDYSNLERALVTKLRSPAISEFIKSVVVGLEGLGIVIDKPKKQEFNTESIYVCMTGSPKNYGFSTKEDFITKWPNLVEVSITDKKCQFLITDSYESSSNKMTTAGKKGITIKTYGDFKI